MSQSVPYSWSKPLRTTQITLLRAAVVNIERSVYLGKPELFANIHKQTKEADLHLEQFQNEGRKNSKACAKSSAEFRACRAYRNLHHATFMVAFRAFAARVITKE